MFNADTDISFTTFREQVWPETWDPRTTLLARMTSTINEQDNGIDEADEVLVRGEHTGLAARVKTRGKWYPVVLDKQFPDGDYLAIFDDQIEARVPFRQISLNLLRKRIGGSDV
jgi:hypothetical protein